jgi:hypothetical protein
MRVGVGAEHMRLARLTGVIVWCVLAWLFGLMLRAHGLPFMGQAGPCWRVYCPCRGRRAAWVGCVGTHGREHGACIAHVGSLGIKMHHLLRHSTQRDQSGPHALLQVHPYAHGAPRTVAACVHPRAHAHACSTYSAHTRPHACVHSNKHQLCGGGGGMSSPCAALVTSQTLVHVVVSVSVRRVRERPAAAYGPEHAHSADCTCCSG